MIMLRGYKSVVFWLIFVSLWIIGCFPCCTDGEKDVIEEGLNKDKNNVLINDNNRINENYIRSNNINSNNIINNNDFNFNII